MKSEEDWVIISNEVKKMELNELKHEIATTAKRLAEIRGSL
jgi:hypothetical protein